jgi:hypothetical protein
MVIKSVIAKACNINFHVFTEFKEISLIFYVHKRYHQILEACLTNSESDRKVSFTYEKPQFDNVSSNLFSVAT